MYEPNNMHAPRDTSLRRHIGIITLVVIVLLGSLCFYLYKFTSILGPFSSMWEGQTATETFTAPLILSLPDPVKDENGIPYSGTVLYDPASSTYSYIATEDEGLVTPVAPDAFSSSDTRYLALRAGASSNEFAIYDSSTLAPVRSVKDLAPGQTITTAVWSPSASTFAYLVAGVDSPTMFVEHVDEPVRAESFGFDIPLGFSPDSSKVLVRGTSGVGTLRLSDHAFVPVVGADFSEETRLMLSPSGEYVIALSGGALQWYAIDWDMAALNLLGTAPLSSEVVDAVFMPDGSLLVREKGSTTGSLYAYEGEKGIVPSSVKLSLPAGARILHVGSR
jgi:hypothetical protein